MEYLAAAIVFFAFVYAYKTPTPRKVLASGSFGMTTYMASGEAGQISISYFDGDSPEEHNRRTQAACAILEARTAHHNRSILAATEMGREQFEARKAEKAAPLTAVPDAT